MGFDFGTVLHVGEEPAYCSDPNIALQVVWTLVPMNHFCIAKGDQKDQALSSGKLCSARCQCFRAKGLGGKFLRNKDLWPFQNCDLEANVTLA